MRGLQAYIPSKIKKSIHILLYEVRPIVIEYRNFQTVITDYCARVMNAKVDWSAWELWISSLNVSVFGTFYLKVVYL